jgi:hypothetical protein
MSKFKDHLLGEEDRRLKAVALGELAEAGIDVFCWCNRCSHNAVLGTDRLLAEMGPAQAVPEIGARLRCTGCGSKDIATRPAWPSLGQVTRHS